MGDLQSQWAGATTKTKLQQIVQKNGKRFKKFGGTGLRDHEAFAFQMYLGKLIVIKLPYLCPTFPCHEDFALGLLTLGCCNYFSGHTYLISTLYSVSTP